MRCEWCQSTNYNIVYDGIYDHYICNNCHHEWDLVTKDKNRLFEISIKNKEIIDQITEIIKLNLNKEGK
jgi:transposase-like protein